MKYHHMILDGKRIAYSSESHFHVQVGKGKGKYKTKYSFKGELGQACMYYLGVNVGNGYKKRLFCPEMNKPVLARVIT